MRRLAGIVAVAIVVALPATALAAPQASGVFVDDDGYPSEQEFEHLAALGVLHGCDPPANTRVCPDRILTRVEAAKVLVGLARSTGVLFDTRPGTVDHFGDDDATWDGAAEPSSTISPTPGSSTGATLRTTGGSARRRRCGGVRSPRWWCRP